VVGGEDVGLPSGLSYLAWTSPWEIPFVYVADIVPFAVNASSAGWGDLRQWVFEVTGEPWLFDFATSYFALNSAALAEAMQAASAGLAYGKAWLGARCGGCPRWLVPSENPAAGFVEGLGAARARIRVTSGIEDARGILRYGGYDPATKTVHLGDAGHFGGMKAAGGTPVPGKTPGLSMLETEKEVMWANDSLSLPRALTAEEAAGIQKALQAQFPAKIVKQVLHLK
jgi:hypothetical protein